jgi:tetratricopeptide (TPR) repeat protein
MRLLIPVLLLLSACLSRRELFDEKTPMVLPPSQVLSVSPADMRTALNAEYRLQPDRRFQQAVAAISRIAGDSGDPQIDIRFSQGSWKVSVADRPVGTFEQLPDFDILHATLKQWAAAELGRKGVAKGVHTPMPASEAGIQSFEIPSLMAALQDADAQWDSIQNVDAMKIAASASARLLLQQVDEVEVADRFQGQAWALLAVAEALGNEPLTHERCIVSKSLGYARSAIRCADHLPANDPLRAYLLNDTGGLETLSAQTGNEGRYLWQVYLAEHGWRQRWEEAMKTSAGSPYATLALLRTGIKLHDFEWTWMFSNALVLETFGMVHAISGKGPDLAENIANDQGRVYAYAREALNVNLRWKIDAIHKRLLDLEPKGDGQIFDVQSVAAYFLGFLYSGLYSEGMYYVDIQSSIPSAEDFLKQLDGEKEGMQGAFYRWYKNLIGAMKGEDVDRAMVHDIAHSEMGPKALEVTLGRLELRLESMDPRWPALTRLWGSRLDERPYHRGCFGVVMLHRLSDLPVSEKLIGAMVRDADVDYPYQLNWYAKHTQNVSALINALQDPRFAEFSDEFMRSLSELGSNGDVDGEFYKVLGNFDGNYTPNVSRFVDYLEKADRVADAQTVVMRWLKGHTRENSVGLDYVFASSAMARLLYKQGRYSEALEYALPVTESWQGGAMVRGGLILDKVGRAQEAEVLFQRGVKRYPNAPEMMSQYVGFLWRHGRLDDGTQLLSDWISQYTFRQCDEAMRARFLELSEELSPAQMSAIVKNFMAKRPSDHVENWIWDIGNKNPQLAFDLLGDIPAVGQRRMFYLVSRYKYLKRLQGKEAALAWIKKEEGSFPPQGSMVVYEEEQYDLLWELFPAEDSMTRVLRAVAALQLPATDPRRAALVERLQKPSRDRYTLIARYLLDLAPEETFWPLADSLRHRCEIAYYRAMKAKAAGDWVAASDWMRVAVETTSTIDGEFAWSIYQLQDWVYQNKSLALIQAASVSP